MSRWGNSKELTQSSYALIKEHPSMNRYAVRAAVHGAVVGGLGGLLGLVIATTGGVLSDSSDGGAFGIIALVLGVVIMAASAVAGLTAANLQLAGLVSATDDVLHGRDLDEQAAKAAAHSKLGTLAAWSGISVVVGWLVSLTSGDGEGGFISSIVRSLLAGLVAAVWAVVTTLVMPVIVLEQLGAGAAIKRSASLIRSTWGESVLGSVRIGARFFLRFTLPGMILLIGGIALAVAVGGAAVAAGAVLVVLGIGLIVVGAIKVATCRNVFGVALYRWATGDGALGPFSDEDLRGAVRLRGGAVPAGV